MMHGRINALCNNIETLLRPSMAGLVTIIEGRTMAISKAEATPPRCSLDHIRERTPQRVVVVLFVRGRGRGEENRVQHSISHYPPSRQTAEPLSDAH